MKKILFVLMFLLVALVTVRLAVKKKSSNILDILRAVGAA